MRTLCEYCNFKVGNPQTGCELNRIENFKNNTELTKENGFYVIPRICNTFHQGDKTAKEIRDFVKTKICVVINCHEFSSEEIQETLESIKSQELLPKYIYCIFQNSKSIVDKFQENNSSFSKLDVNFNIKTYLQTTDKETVLLEIAEKLYHKVQYITIIDAGQKIDDLSKIDKTINEEMKIVHVFLGNNTETYSCSSILSYGTPMEVPGMEDYTCKI